MRYEIVLSQEAVQDLRGMSARERSTLRDALEVHLRHEPTKLSRSRIKRLRGLAQPSREASMKKVALSKITEDLPKYLRLAEEEEVVITRDGKPAGVLIGFRSEGDWLEFQLEEDPRFLRRIKVSRKGLREGKGVRLEDIPE